MKFYNVLGKIKLYDFSGLIPEYSNIGGQTWQDITKSLNTKYFKVYLV